MTADTGAGVVPTLGAEDLVRAVPELEAAASLEATTLASLPSASLSFELVLTALQWAREAVDAGARGAVLIQGTDTLEETAFLLDLHWDRPAPLVLTGALRSPQAPGADGPANLLAAVRTAAGAPVDVGVVVVMNDEIHAASRVRKGHTMSTAAFETPVFGPLGVLVEGRPVLASVLPRPTPPMTPQPPAGGNQARVTLVATGLGDDGDLLRLAIAAGHRGVVVSGLGAGHVGVDLADAISEALARGGEAGPMTVVFASRTGAGPTLTHTYGYVGSERDLLERGAIGAGWLNPQQARLLLWSLLASGASDDRIRAEFETRGARP